MADPAGRGDGAFDVVVVGGGNAGISAAARIVCVEVVGHLGVLSVTGTHSAR